MTENEPSGFPQNWKCARTNDGDTSYVFRLQTSSQPPLNDLYELDQVASRPEAITAVFVHTVSRSVNRSGLSSATPLLKVAGVLAPGTAVTGTMTYTDGATGYANNPATALPWTWDDINKLQAGVRHQVADDDEMRTTSVFVQVCWMPPTVTPSITPTSTPSPTNTGTPSTTATATVTRTNSVTATPSASATATPTAPVATATATPLPSPSATATLSPTATATVTSTPSATATAPTATPTVTSTASSTPSITGTRPTATATPQPRISFIFAAGSNQFQCAFDLSTDLGFTNALRSFDRLTLDNPAQLRTLYQVIYVAPGLDSSDYTLLQQLVTPGGVIEQFVAAGGVAVINVAGASGDQVDVAPGGVGYSAATSHNSETIQIANHPYFTGLGFAGDPLSTADFSAWQPTDSGTLTDLPPSATILLQNSDGPSWAEYVYGDGRVIVTTLSYCWIGKPNSDGSAARNLLRYSRFYSGSAQTPGATVTPTFSPTVTPTRTVTSTARPSNTPTPTVGVLVGDVNRDGRVDANDLADLIAALYDDAAPLVIDLATSDVNRDGELTAADIAALVQLLGSS